MSDKNVKLGIDLGTSCSFVSFIHGDKVMALTPSSDRHGIPSVFYYDGKQEYIGKFADSRGRKNPQYALRSIKRRLHEAKIPLADKEFTPKEILTKLFTFLLESAEKRLEAEFPDVEYEGIEVALAMPVDFTVPRVHMMIEALKAVTLKSGKKVYVDGVIQEPGAAAVEYFGLTEKTDTDILVYDLGGGTFDAALVHAAKADAEVPYEVIDQEGIRNLGGDDWDQAFLGWVVDRLKTEHKTSITKQQEKELLYIAREVKHELTEMEETYFDCTVKGEIFSIPVTRTVFDKITKELLFKTVDTVDKVLSRNKDRQVKYLILTGGSSYMPQVKEALEEQIGKKYGVEVRFFEPEHAITYGAARFAHSLICEEQMAEPKGFKGQKEKEDVKAETDKKTKTKKTENPVKNRIKLIAPHGYGISYVVAGMEEKEMIRLFVKKGDTIPAQGTEISAKRGKNRYISEYKIYETDVRDEKDILKKGGRELVDLNLGRLVMTVNLERRVEVPNGSKATQKLILGEDMQLYFEAFDEVNGARVEQKVLISMADIVE